MVSWIKDLPEWATGMTAAAALWFATAYVVLAPRAMELQAQAEMAPSCVAQLEQAKAKRLADAEARRQREQGAAERRLRDAETRLAAAEALTGAMEASGLGGLMQGMGMPMGEAGLADPAALRGEIARIKQKLASPADIAAIAISSADTAATCACAAFKAIAGQRLDYALSLASFRVIAPSEIGASASSVADIARGGACGALPEEVLR